MSSFEFKLKSMTLLANFTNFNECNHISDGLIFTPIHEPLVFGTNFKMYKWKPQLLNTVDFFVDKDCKIFLSCKNCLENTTNSLSNLNSFTHSLPGIFECKYESDGIWSIVKQRLDKSHPNSVYTYNKTLINIHENIQYDEFFNLFKVSHY